MDAGQRTSSDSVAIAGPIRAGQDGNESPERSGFRRLWKEGHRFQFVQAVRLLELASPDAPAPGETARYGDVAVRLRPSSALAFPPTDVERVEKAREEIPVQVVSTFFGLYGIDSPLPYHFYEPLARRTRDTASHRAFLDIFNHRFYAFFYRAWKKYRPSLDVGREEGLHSRRFRSIAGLGTADGKEENAPMPMRLAAHAGILGRQVRNAEGLEALVEGVLGDVPVDVVENVPRWVAIPSRCRLGEERLQLGKNATIGEAIFDRSGKFRLRLGPIGLERYRSLLPERETARLLHRLVRSYVPDHLTYDVELTIPIGELPTTQLGEEGGHLGYTTRLGEAVDSSASVTARIVEYE